ncbi:hypothetical protein P152DRAFT_471151 [Eremomyces bilateralis CBS 781.70]|uniref:Uncharacterized protein n=1 Tax=Eremomyces bilateralis CBS 781.70 TaxID=1392243 RepID=A0A6G1GCJ2_9PEZI|nr:uncharacterized protein P152DRAFT_471151 [Eremomyces bilateralis CBS 781.70]KAF1815753.1 hypothetical protein P152DRAFT_471151 [Eremomyces bilateralis CBS 781.70]
MSKHGEEDLPDPKHRGKLLELRMNKAAFSADASLVSNAWVAEAEGEARDDESSASIAVCEIRPWMHMTYNDGWMNPGIWFPSVEDVLAMPIPSAFKDLLESMGGGKSDAPESAPHSPLRPVRPVHYAGLYPPISDLFSLVHTIFACKGVRSFDIRLAAPPSGHADDDLARAFERFKDRLMRDGYPQALYPSAHERLPVCKFLVRNSIQGQGV